MKLEALNSFDKRSISCWKNAKHSEIWINIIIK